MQNPTRILQYTVRDAMRSYAHLIFTLFVLHARAATIPDNVAPELEKKLTEVFNEAIIDESAPAVSVLAVREQIDEVNPVKDSDNKLKSAQPIENIPVTIVEENVQPLLKRDGEDWSRNNEVDPESENSFKRVEIDLAHPGVPERQEHETQNPEQFDDEKLSTLNIRQAIADTQNVFNQGLQGVGQNIQSFFTHNNQIANIQNSIQNLQKNFNGQIEKLNETIKRLWKPPGSQTRSTIGGELENTQLEQIQSDLKSLQDRFDTGINNLALGVQNIGNLKADTAATSSPSTQPGSEGGFGGFFQNIVTNIQNFQNQMSQGFNNIFNNIQNVSQSPPSQTINDSPASNGPGGFFQSWLQGTGNIFNFGSNQQQSGTTQSGQDSGPLSIFAPIVTAFQNNPISQFFSNINKPSSTTNVQQSQTSQQVVNQQQSNKPSQPASSQPGTGSTSSTEASKPSECDKCDSHSSDKPVDPDTDGTDDDDSGANSDDSRRKQTTAPPSSPRPVIDAIQRNPIVKGISDAVQRLQGSVTPVEKQRIADEESSKKILFGGGGHGDHGGGPASGDNNGSVGLAEEIVSVKEKNLPTESSSADTKGAEGVIEEYKPVAEKTE